MASSIFGKNFMFRFSRREGVKETSTVVKETSLYELGVRLYFSDSARLQVVAYPGPAVECGAEY
jgi:hypothetical protein